MGRWVSVKFAALLFGLAGLVAGTVLAAAPSPVGTWKKKAEGGAPEMTMTIESWGIGNTRLSYSSGEHGNVATVASRMDGFDAPVLANGKPTPASMAFKLTGQRTATVVSKLNLQTVGTSIWTFSPDFKTLTVENDFTHSMEGLPTGKSVERWTRQ